MSSPKPLCDLKVAICIFHTIYALHTDLSLFMILTSLSPVARYFTSWLMKQLSWSWLSLPLIGSSSSDSVHFMLNSRVKKKPGSLDFISLPTTMKEQCSLLKWNLYLYIYISQVLKCTKIWLTKTEGYLVSNSTPKYWSMKFFFAEAEAAPPSDSVWRLKITKFSHEFMRQP